MQDSGRMKDWAVFTVPIYRKKLWAYDCTAKVADLMSVNGIRTPQTRAIVTQWKNDNAISTAIERNFVLYRQLTSTFLGQFERRWPQQNALFNHDKLETAKQLEKRIFTHPLYQIAREYDRLTVLSLLGQQKI